MNRYIKRIKVNNIFHLRNFQISIEEDKSPHLIITGKNGSGKTSILNAIVEHLDYIKEDVGKNFASLKDKLKRCQKWQKDNTDPNDTLSIEQNVMYYQDQIKKYFGKVEIDFTDIDSFIRNYQKSKFIIAFYQADRKVRMSEPINPTKPNIKEKWNVKETATQEFLNFLSDLKIQEALARNEKLEEEANVITRWFSEFEGLLKEVFQDDDLRLVFNYKDYSFRIGTEGKSFKFTEMSDGFAAVLDVIVDLILKMQNKDKLTRAYEQEGIVLIDEIETHLHLELQKIILPLLTKIFPNIQFIVTTHSPFVLNSLNSAMAFDLEHKETITNLTEYSYESLAEGYFGVRTDSSYMVMQLNTLKTLLGKETLTLSEKVEVKNLMTDFDKIPEPASPIIVGEYLQLKSNSINKIQRLLSDD